MWTRDYNGLLGQRKRILSSLGAAIKVSKMKSPGAEPFSYCNQIFYSYSPNTWEICFKQQAGNEQDRAKVFILVGEKYSQDFALAGQSIAWRFILIVTAEGI